MFSTAFANTCSSTAANFCDTSEKCLALNKAGDKPKFKFEGNKCLVIIADAKAEDCIAGNQAGRAAKPAVGGTGATTPDSGDGAAKR